MTPKQIAETLRDGADADIWYDAADHGDDEADARIEKVREAMHAAADLLDPPGQDDDTVEAYRRAAKSAAVDGELEVDDDARVSIGDDDGAYVQAWVWVPGSVMREVTP